MEWLLELRQKDASAGSATANDKVNNNSRAINFTMCKIGQYIKKLNSYEN